MSCSQQGRLWEKQLPNTAAASRDALSVGCSRPRPASPGDSPRPAGRSGPGSCQITAFAPGSGGCESLCAPFESKVFLDPVGT